MVEEEGAGDEDDVDVNGDVDGVYDYVLMSLPCFRVISVTRTILGRNHFHSQEDRGHLSSGARAPEVWCPHIFFRGFLDDVLTFMLAVFR